MKTTKMIFFETEQSAWICDYDRRKSYEYENNVKPLRMQCLTCTMWYRRQLLNLLEEDQDEFIHQVREELTAALSFYSN